jgi:protoporphyrinogen/coproporphyrinogen III oxidase
LESVGRKDHGFELSIRDLDGSRTIFHDILIFAIPPVNAATYLEGLDSRLTQRLKEIESSTIAVLALGFKAADIINPLDGFGYLIPRKEGVRSLGVLWSSSIFPGRAPKDHKLLQIMIGGAHDLRAIELNNEDLIDQALREANPVLGIKGRPVMAKVIRHSNGIPQYNLGHKDRINEIQARVQNIENLYLAGNGYLGISTNDCIRHGRELAEKVVEQLIQS